MPIMLMSLRPNQTFVDGFCGGCAVIQRVPKEHRRIANDNNGYLIAMFQRLTMTDWKPQQIIEKPYYDKVRATYHAHDGIFDDATIGRVGYMGSRNGRFFDGGYSGHHAKDGRDYIAENIRNISKQIPDLRGIEWQNGSYDKMQVPDASLLYLDPPYRGTSGYPTARHFNHEAFYDFCRQMKRDGHTVFVSELICLAISSVCGRSRWSIVCIVQERTGRRKGCGRCREFVGGLLTKRSWQIIHFFTFDEFKKQSKK